MKKKLSLILAIIMVASLALAALPISASALEAPAEPTISGNQDDIVATIANADGTNKVNIYRSNFATTFANGATLTSNYTGDYVIELLMSIDVGEAQLMFTAAEGKTGTIKGDVDGDGTHCIIKGSHTGSPTIRAGGAGTVVFDKVDYYKTTNNLLQYYNGVTVDIVDCNWTAKNGGIRPSATGTVNVKGNSVILSGAVVFEDGWTFDGTTPRTAPNTLNIEGTAIVGRTGEDMAARAISFSNPNTTVTVNGGTVSGTVQAAAGTLNLTAGKINGNVDIKSDVIYNKANAFVIDTSAVVETTPFELDESIPAITGADTDVIVKIYVGTSTTPVLQVTRGEYATAFKNDASVNVLATNSALLNQNVKIEFVNDVDVGEVQTAFYINPGKTLTVEGNDKTLLGYEAGNPVVRFRSLSDGGNIVVNDLTIFGARASALQYYGNLIIDFNNSNIKSFSHTAIWPTGTGSAAVLNLNDGTVVYSGGTCINAGGSTGNVININEGAKLLCAGSTAVSMSTATELNIKGEIVNESDNGMAINVKDDAIGATVCIDGGSVTGDIEIADFVYVDFLSGNIDGELTLHASSNEYVIIEPEFVINGETDVDSPVGGDDTTDPSGDNTTAPSGDGTTAPSGDGTTAPSGDGTTAPSGDGTTAPSGDGNTEPSGDGTTAPSGDGTNAPSGNGTNAPSGDGTKAPSDGEDDTTAGEAPAGGCAGCGGIGNPAVTTAAAIVIAMAAAVAIIVKKK